MDGYVSLCQAACLEVGCAVHELVEGAVVLLELAGVLTLLPPQLSEREPDQTHYFRTQLLKVIFVGLESAGHVLHMYVAHL